jgi:hypothetical protein
MSDTRSAGSGSRPAGSMEAVDRKLNVFALANGMDLDRRGEVRVLGWYRDGMERCVRLEPAEGGTWAVRAAAARDSRQEGEVVRTLESALDVEQILTRFKELMAGAMDAANAIASEEVERRP